MKTYVHKMACRAISRAVLFPVARSVEERDATVGEWSMGPVCSWGRHSRPRAPRAEAAGTCRGTGTGRQIRLRAARLRLLGIPQ